MKLRDIEGGTEFILKRNGKAYKKSVSYKSPGFDLYVCTEVLSRKAGRKFNLHGGCEIEILNKEETTNASN
ncbi:hypothetical protein J8Z28_07685 [Pseudoalteromonas sp. SCSIO 43088]|uniref:hypothetical protein n=1 Tax=Pseudoalteromonas sp. SCSIO 43088 TaxID=2822846 RepID=UPI00202B2CE9|nr:hypothetical protein [Pseudoalteromonas sp. SCSIO 43088]URQ87713.1 hypothetical protein J8Z28_07685 [Pseudoalteromonas sp. SCSIO 43088]